MHPHDGVQITFDACNFHSQMANFVGSHDDAAESAGILDDRNTVDLLEALIHDACSTNVRESCGQLNDTI